MFEDEIVDAAMFDGWSSAATPSPAWAASSTELETEWGTAGTPASSWAVPAQASPTWNATTPPAPSWATE